MLGQPDFVTNTFGLSTTEFKDVMTPFSDGTRLLVADNDNGRVLIWNAVPTSTQTPADLVVGQPDFATTTALCNDSSLNAPDAAVVAAGKLIVGDRTNNRVLIWNSVPTTNGAPADVVLGQDSFTNCVPNDDDQNGVDDGVPTARTLNFVTGLWSDGERLVVADNSNHRVLIWNTIPTTNFTPADLVLGQPDFVTSTQGSDAQTFSSPRQVFSNGNQLFVADFLNSRVLGFDSFPTVNGTAADRVLGQSTFTNSDINDDDQNGIQDAGPTARTLYYPTGVFAFDSKLIVTDGLNNRFLIFESQ